MRVLLAGAIIALLVALPRGEAASAGFSWADVEGRIQYAWFTEDARALERLDEALSGEPAGDRLQGYYGALLAWRAGELASRSGDRSRARERAGRCVARAERALHADPDFGEAHALQSACLLLLGRVEGWRVPFAGSRADAQIEAALRLAPTSPRVLLVEALAQRERAGAQGADRDRLAAALRRAAAAFETERTEAERTPGWGAADAWVELARVHLERGDVLAARDALERALLLAPEYAEARRLMQKLMAG